MNSFPMPNLEIYSCDVCAVCVTRGTEKTAQTVICHWKPIILSIRLFEDPTEIKLHVGESLIASDEQAVKKNRIFYLRNND